MPIKLEGGGFLAKLWYESVLATDKGERKINKLSNRATREILTDDKEQ